MYLWFFVFFNCLFYFFNTGVVASDEEQNVSAEEQELILEERFLVPNTNSFGHTFRFSSFNSWYHRCAFFCIIDRSRSFKIIEIFRPSISLFFEIVPGKMNLLNFMGYTPFACYRRIYAHDIYLVFSWYCKVWRL